MSVERFLDSQRQRMIDRVEREALDWSTDHLPAYTLMSRAAVALIFLTRPKGTENEFYAQLNDDVLKNLAEHGVTAEIYALRGDLGSGWEEDSRNFLRVISRNGVATGVERKRDVLSRVVVRASTESATLSKGGE